MINKRLLFHYSVFNTGGAERSTSKLMTALCNKGWDVTLLLNIGGGDFESQVDPRITILHLRDKEFGSQFKSARSILGKIKALPDLFNYLCSRVQQYFRLKKIKKQEYQAAIVSLQGLSPKIVLDNVNSNVVIHMIRNDISKIQNKPKVLKAINNYHPRINNYICVAQKTKDALLAKYPSLIDKTNVIHNLLESDKMLAALTGQSDPYMAYSDKLKVVTVCRLNNAAKGLLRMAEVHKELICRGYDFYWFVIGEGGDRSILEAKIHELNIGNSFIPLGHRDNPYPYYYYADVSATLSYYEGFCGTVNEAKVMGKPVIATRFSGVEEQIIPYKNGIIVENNEDAILEGMLKVLTNQELREKMTNDFLPEKVKNDELKLKKLLKLINTNNPN